jgi:hypothetical protein
MFLLSSAYSVLVTMADEDPLAAAWRCCVPVRISLASNEIASNDVPGSMPVPPIYVGCYRAVRLYTVEVTVHGQGFTSAMVRVQVLAPRHSYIHTLAGYAWPLVQVRFPQASRTSTVAVALTQSDFSRVLFCLCSMCWCRCQVRHPPSLGWSSTSSH